MAAATHRPALRPGWRLAAVLGAALGVVAVGLVLTFGTSNAGRKTPASATPGIGDAAGDCAGCTSRGDITQLAVQVGDRGAVVSVTLVRPASEGESLTLWRSAAAAVPLRVSRGAGGSWALETPANVAGNATDATETTDVRIVEQGKHVHLTLPAALVLAAGGLAVTSADGDRVPDAGYVTRRGAKLVVRTVDGDGANRSLRRISQAQAAMGKLDAGQRMLATQLLARQQLSGTFTYEVPAKDEPGGFVRMVSVIDGTGMRSRQDELVRVGGKWQITTSRVVSDRNARYCTAKPGAKLACLPDRVDEDPATQSLAMQHAAAHVELRPGKARSVLGSSATCIVIARSVPDGPSEGERCAGADGALLYVVYSQAGRTLTLVKRSDEIDEQAFAVVGA